MTAITEKPNSEKKYLKDKYATRLFKDEDLREWTLKIIASITKINYETLSKDFKIIDIKVGPAEDVKALEADFVAESADMFVSMEFNYLEKYKYTDNKNFSYVCALTLKQVKPGENKNYKIKPIIQISLDGFDRFKRDQLIYTSVFMEENLLIPRESFIRLFDVNLDFLEKIDYNYIKDFDSNAAEKLLYLFVCDDKATLDKIYLGDKLMEKVREKVAELESNLGDYLYYDREELLKQDSYNVGVEEGIEKGLEQGYKEGQKEIVKNMMNNGLSIEEISKYTGLSEDDIKNLNEKNWGRKIPLFCIEKR